MAPFLLVTKSSPPSGGLRKRRRLIRGEDKSVQWNSDVHHKTTRKNKDLRACNDIDEDVPYDSYINP